jgi:site-specific recombinase XerD
MTTAEALISKVADRPGKELMVAKTKPSWPRVTGPLAQYAEGFRAELDRLGYKPLTAANHLRLVAHLSRWLATQGLDTTALTHSTVESYFATRRSAGYTADRTARTLARLLDYLRQAGAAPLPVATVPASATEQLLTRYWNYLKVERGLAATTADLNVRLVRPFLVGHAGERDGNLALGELTAGHVATFVVDQARHRPRSVKRIVSALRSILGFLYVEGSINQPLAEAVPSPPGWALTGLPKALSESQVAALLASCNPGTATGRRDLAVLTLLSRLGLRAGEVAALGLDDIDWRRGELVVRGKANRVARLPLPGDVGARIVAYLRDGRPATATGRTVFVGAQAPHRALSSTPVTTVVANAGRRAGLGTIGAHRLRHSAATAMLRAGGSLREIGDVLRHRRALTTAIYAKLDLDALRSLARPWPGEAR